MKLSDKQRDLLLTMKNERKFWNSLQYPYQMLVETILGEETYIDGGHFQAKLNEVREQYIQYLKNQDTLVRRFQKLAGIIK